MSAPYIPLYIDDYDAATAHLTPEEDGIYGRLLRLCWRTPGCSIPNEPEWIARKIRLSMADYERIAAPVIAEFFTVVRGRLTQKRLREEFAKYAETKRKRSEAGKRGGRPKSLKENEISKSPAMVLLKQPEPEPEPEPERIDTLEDKSSKAPDPLADPDRMAWETATRVLTVQGAVGEKSAKAFFGRLLSQNGLEARDLLAATVQAQVNQTGDPQGYLTKAAAAIAKRRAPPLKAVGFV
jgi:uncharacterized protein YdaU (DUF1376 family)